MELCSLLLALVPSGHAAYHPTEADLYLEVPHVGEALAAFSKAPMASFLAEDAVRGFLGMVMESGEIDGVAALSSLAEDVFGVQGAEELLRSTRGVSLSVRLPGEGRDLGLLWIADLPGAEAAGSLASRLAGGGETFRSSLLPGIELWSRAEGDRLLVGGGAWSPDHYAPEATLEEATDFRSGMGHFGERGGTTVLRVHQRRSPAEFLRLLMGDSMGMALPSGSAMSALLGGERSLRMNFVDGRFVTDLFEKTEPSFLGNQPVRKAWLDVVAPDAMFAYSTSVQGEGAAQLLGSFISAEQRASVEAELGFSIDELVADVGPGAVVYANPLRGPALPETYAWVEIGDAVGFCKAVTDLCTYLAESDPEFDVKTKDYRVKDAASGERIKIPITTLSLPPSMAPSMGMIPAPRPSFAAAQGKLVISASEMHLKRELKRVYGEQEGSGAALFAPFAVPEDARSVVFMSWNRLVEGVLSLARSLGGMLGGMGGGEMPDLSKLPDASLFTRHFSPTVHYSRAVEGGRLRYHEASFGPETWLFPALAGVVGWERTSQALQSETAGAEPVTTGQ